MGRVAFEEALVEALCPVRVGNVNCGILGCHPDRKIAPFAIWSGGIVATPTNWQHSLCVQNQTLA